VFDYPGLAALAAVLREGSFERAARALHVTPSAVSQRVRNLEERAGCALVVRGQPCLPTATGQQLVQHLEHVRQLEHTLQARLPGRARSPAGAGAGTGAELPRVTLPVAVNADSLATWFAPVLVAHAAEAPVLLQLAVDDQDHTAQWLRQGTVVAAVSSLARAPAGCNSRALGAMRYVAAASPAFMARHFPQGVGAGSLARAPSLQFNTKDELQNRWARRLCHRHVELPRHTLPSPQAFVTAALGGMGWGLQPQALVAAHLASGALVELVPGATLDVPLHWHHARAASELVAGLTRAVLAAAKVALRPA
jgi:LysR family transcriptional regulator, chromosome initiation inhibitor